MLFQLNAFGIFLILGSILALFIMNYSYKRKDNKIYYYLFFAALFYFFDSFFQGMECLTTPFIIKSFFGQFSALGYLLLAPMWVLLVYTLTHNQKDLSNKYKYPLLLIAIVTLIIAFTNPWTHLYYSNISLPTHISYKLQLSYTGTWIFMLSNIYEMIISVICVLMLLIAIVKGSKIYRKSYLVVFIATIIGQLIVLLTFTPIYPGLSFAVLAYTIVFIFFSIAVPLYNAFDIVNEVNEIAIDDMNIGILSFNNQNNLSSVNNACQYIGITKNQLNQNAGSVFKELPDLLNFYNNNDLKVYDFQYKNQWLEIKKSDIIEEDDYLGKALTVTNITSRMWELNQKDMLVKEVNHRVKNNFQIILSLINLDLRYHPNDPLSVLNDTRSRLNYMSTLHEKLYNSEHYTEVDINDYLPDIAKGLLSMYNSNINLNYELEPVMVDLDLSVSLGLILTEVINNTIKYAFPTGKPGNFYMKFLKENNYGVLDLYDDGKGLPDDFDFESSTGLGMTVIKSLTAQINGEAMIIPAEGSHFRIKFPLN